MTIFSVGVRFYVLLADSYERSLAYYVLRCMVARIVCGSFVVGRGDVADRGAPAPGLISRRAAGDDGGDHLGRSGRHDRGRGRGLLRCSLPGERPGGRPPRRTSLPSRGEGGVRLQLRPRAGFTDTLTVPGEERWRMISSAYQSEWQRSSARWTAATFGEVRAHGKGRRKSPCKGSLYSPASRRVRARDPDTHAALDHRRRVRWGFSIPPGW